MPHPSISTTKIVGMHFICIATRIFRQFAVLVVYLCWGTTSASHNNLFNCYCHDAAGIFYSPANLSHNTVRNNQVALNMTRSFPCGRTGMSYILGLEEESGSISKQDGHPHAQVRYRLC
jgi:hypothetical protein